MESNCNYQSPFSNFEIVILANTPETTKEIFNNQLLGLLTIGNKPILQHIIDQVIHLRFTKIILVCNENDRSHYTDFLFPYLKMDDSNVKIQIFTANDLSTCGIIRKVVALTLPDQFEVINSNQCPHIVIYPIELIISSICLNGAVDFHLETHSMITLIASKVDQGITEKEKETAPGHFKKAKYISKGKRLLVYNETNPKQLVQLLSDADSIRNDYDLVKNGSEMLHEEEHQFSISESKEELNDNGNEIEDVNEINDENENEEEVPFSLEDSMNVSGYNMKRFNSLIVDPSIVLTNAYILSPECIRYLFKKDNVKSIESELIPMICLQKMEKKSLKASIFLSKNEKFSFKITDYVSLFVANMRCAAANLAGFTPNADLVQVKPKEENASESDVDDIDDDDEVDETDEIENYKNLLNSYYKEKPLTIPNKFVFSAGNVYGANLIVQSNNTVIKRSVIGKHCKIGKRAKIINSVLFDHVTIDDGVKLKNCIVCTNSVLITNSSLKQCVVAPGFHSDKKIISENSLVQLGDK